MTTAAFSREWFTMYCQNAAANVLDKDDNIRFTYDQLHNALNDIHTADEILTLDTKITALCNSKLGENVPPLKATMLLTLCNIHAAYLMLSGKWKEEPEQKVSECGFEIF